MEAGCVRTPVPRYVELNSYKSDRHNTIYGDEPNMAVADTHVIAIVGGGFSGTATAINLLRDPGARPLRIHLIERGSEFGRGLAYARREYPYLLNVPASRMSATIADPDEFLRYA